MTLFYLCALSDVFLRTTQYFVEMISKASAHGAIFVLSQITGLLRVDLAYIVMFQIIQMRSLFEKESAARKYFVIGFGVLCALSNVPDILFWDLEAKSRSVAFGDYYLVTLFLLVGLGITVAALRLYCKIQSLETQGSLAVPIKKGPIVAVMLCYIVASIISAILNSTKLPKAYSENRTESIWFVLGWTMVPGIVSDCLPIVAMMYLHYQNFSARVDVVPKNACINNGSPEENIQN